MQSPLNAPPVRRLAPWLIGAAAFGAVAWTLSRIPVTATIFTLAALIAFGAAPAVRGLERRRAPRPAAIAAVYAALALALGVVVLLVVPATVAQAQAILASAPDLATNLQALAHDLDRGLQGRLGPSYAIGAEQLRGMIAGRVDAWTATALGSFTSWIVQAATALFALLSAIVLSAFFLAQAEGIGAGFRRCFPPARRHLAHEFEHELARVFGGFVAGQAALCAVTAVAVWSALTILRVPFAIVAGVAAGLGYAIPFVGMLVVQVGAALLALPEGWPTALRATIAIFAVARVVDALIAPKVMSESVGVSPIAVMFAVFAGGELFGVAGLALGVPAAALAKTLWTVFLRTRADAAATVRFETPPPT